MWIEKLKEDELKNNIGRYHHHIDKYEKLEKIKQNYMGSQSARALSDTPGHSKTKASLGNYKEILDQYENNLRHKNISGAF